jgi:hypothetical protein
METSRPFGEIISYKTVKYLVLEADKKFTGKHRINKLKRYV